jgi:hypothetical protein
LGDIPAFFELSHQFLFQARSPSAHDRGCFLVQHRFSMPKILCDAQEDCGEPGCLNDDRILVLARATR